MSERKLWHHSHYERGCWRWWLHSESTDLANVEISWRSGLTGFWFCRSESGKIRMSVGLYVLYVTAGIRLPWIKADCARDFSITFHDWAVRWCIWRDPWGGWDHTVPRWRDGSFHPIDAIFGRPICTRTTKERREVVVPMPERPYEATAELVEFSWKRPRFPWSKKMLRVSIDIPGGIPHSGKGENSWDCGDDGTFSITTGKCHSIPEGVGVLVGSCLRDRVRYGGWGEWVWKKDAVTSE